MRILHDKNTTSLIMITLICKSGKWLSYRWVELVTTKAGKIEPTSFIDALIGQGSRITIRLPYVIAYVWTNFGVRNVLGQIAKSIHRASYLLPSDFPNNFSQARSYLNRMKDCWFGKHQYLKFYFKKNPLLNPNYLIQKIYCLKTVSNFVL